MPYFYRLVETDPPTREQFVSYYELGVTPPGASAREFHLSKGVSMFETEDQARQAAPTMKKKGDDLLRWVVRVAPVRVDSTRESR